MPGSPSSNTILKVGFKQSQFDPSMDLHHTSASVIILIVDVDDIIIMAMTFLALNRYKPSPRTIPCERSW